MLVNFPSKVEKYLTTRSGVGSCDEESFTNGLSVYTYTMAERISRSFHVQTRIAVIFDVVHKIIYNKSFGLTMIETTFCCHHSDTHPSYIIPKSRLFKINVKNLAV